MEKTLTLEPTAQEAADLQAAITQCFAGMDAARERMRLADESIEESRQETLRNLTEIANVLAELRAA